LQGYVYFRNAKTLGAVRTLLPSCHLIRALGTSKQNQLYCSKGGDFIERGDPPKDDDDRGTDEINRYARSWDLAKLGKIEDIPADIRLRLYPTIKRIERDYMPRVEPLPDICGLWIYGESGTGKTRNVLSIYPGIFPKPRNIWWDGYQGEPEVLIDDFDKFDIKLGGQLKHWADFAPFIGQTKGSSIKIRPGKLIITSQYRIEEIWDDKETRDALKRRFVVLEKIKDVLLVF